MNLVDTSGWLEYFFNGKNATHFAKPIEDTDNLIISVLNIYEVFKKVCSVADEARALEAIAHMKQGEVVILSEEISLKAAQVSLKYKLAMADSIIYATSEIHNSLLWTQDVDFINLPNVNYKK
ncbi:MAG: PIN domain-containing protein [Planctomycetota bacterium]|jgi:predicted nucleic acid-binding protein